MHKIVNGQRVELTKEEIAQRKADEDAHNAKAFDRKLEETRRKRAAAYPNIGDQLDIMLKYFDSLTDKSKITKDLKDLVDYHKAVKEANPLPTKE